jgi:glycerol-3-phosphate acyltransferase PlsY
MPSAWQEPSWFTLGIWLAVAFLAGALPFGYWIGKVRGVDVTATGSGNIGATNVSRSLGYGWGVAVLVLDALKVAVPAALSLTLMGSPSTAAAIAMVGTLGHVFSPFVGWKGGKGVACLLGGTLVVSPAAAAISVLVFIAVIATTRISSLASLIAVASLPISLWLFGAPVALIYYGVLAASLVLWTHRENLQRLRRGDEPRMGKRSAP